MEGLLHDITSYVPGDGQRLCIVDTDIREPELMIRRIAAKTAREYPERFYGETPQVFFRMHYTPPYETFRDLRELILQVRQATGLRSEFRGLLCIDPSEFRGHEGEEYFTAFLKYLYDHAEHSTVLLVCCQYPEASLSRLCSVCLKYFPVCREKIHLYEREMLEQLLYQVCEEKEIGIAPQACSLLADALASPKLNPYRSLQLIERIPGECRRKRALSGKTGRVLSVEDVKSYLSDPGSSLFLMAGHSLYQERGTELFGQRI